ncbi:hypothetical protein evm_007751 [Chilo suppressalis]|nr:hypothetical protein evm_007751 [Chilo suppressalis]
MSRLQACRVCLAHHSRMYSIQNGPLQEIYEKVTETPLLMNDTWPTCLCYICYHMMRKFRKFIDKSLKANKLLLQLISSESEVTIDTLDMIVTQQPDIIWKFAVTPIESILPLDSEEVKLEATFKIEKVKAESDFEETLDQKEADYTVPIEFANDDPSSDSEDNMPLQNIRTRNTEKIKKRPKVKIKKKKNVPELKIPPKTIKPDAREILLTKDQQMQQMLERAKSLNYLNSPFKCELCYKGFIDTRAYENHKEKHDENKPVIDVLFSITKYRSHHCILYTYVNQEGAQEELNGAKLYKLYDIPPVSLSLSRTARGCFRNSTSSAYFAWGLASILPSQLLQKAQQSLNIAAGLSLSRTAGCFRNSTSSAYFAWGLASVLPSQPLQKAQQSPNVTAGLYYSLRASHQRSPLSCSAPAHQ